MVGVTLGLVCGLAEFWLLRKLVFHITKGERLPLWIVPVKFLTLAAFLVPCALFFSEELAFLGAGAAAGLIAGAVLQFIWSAKSRGSPPGT